MRSAACRHQRCARRTSQRRRVVMPCPAMQCVGVFSQNSPMTYIRDCIIQQGGAWRRSCNARVRARSMVGGTAMRACRLSAATSAGALAACLPFFSSKRRNLARLGESEIGGLDRETRKEKANGRTLGSPLLRPRLGFGGFVKGRRGILVPGCAVDLIVVAA